MDVTTEEYTLLFNTITETIQRLESIKASLIFAQQRAEELVISAEEGSETGRDCRSGAAFLHSFSLIIDSSLRVLIIAVYDLCAEQDR